MHCCYWCVRNMSARLRLLLCELYSKLTNCVILDKVFVVVWTKRTNESNFVSYCILVQQTVTNGYTFTEYFCIFIWTKLSVFTWFQIFYKHVEDFSISDHDIKIQQTKNSSRESLFQSEFFSIEIILLHKIAKLMKLIAVVVKKKKWGENRKQNYFHFQCKISYLKIDLISQTAKK